jgi:hypothetical protein
VFFCYPVGVGQFFVDVAVLFGPGLIGFVLIGFLFLKFFKHGLQIRAIVVRLLRASQ